MLLMTTANLHRNTSFLVHFSLRSTYVPCLICVSISVKLGLLKRQLNESFFLSIIALLSLKCIKYFSFGGCFGKLNRSQSFSCVVPLYKKAFQTPFAAIFRTFPKLNCCFLCCCFSSVRPIRLERCVSNQHLVFLAFHGQDCFFFLALPENTSSVTSCNCIFIVFLHIACYWLIISLQLLNKCPSSSVVSS